MEPILGIFNVYDLVFMLAFIVVAGIFLYTHRKNLKRQGWLYLYPTKLGIKFIDSFAEKYKRALKPLQYVVVASGFILMISMVWFLVKFTWFYVTSPTAAQALKIPVLMPLIPYLPELFKVDFLPPFYFTYWVIIIALIAIPHEFAHGIFARLNKIKINATGFGFLGPFLAAFVDPDEKQTEKSSKFAQMSILAAGTFANVLVTILFVLLLWGFVAIAYVPAGIYFSYPLVSTNVSDISMANGMPLSSIKGNTGLLGNSTVIEVTIGNQTFLTTASALKQTLENNLSSAIVSLDGPAFRAQMVGAITSIDGEKINSVDSLRTALSHHKPGDNVTVKTAYQENKRSKTEIKEYQITLANNGTGSPILGIGLLSAPKNSGLVGWLYTIVSTIKEPTVYYESKIGDLGPFIYDLLWWIALVSISVALANMLPFGIFDGGRFFYLSVWGITKQEKYGKYAFAISKVVIITILVLLMVKWVIVLPFLQKIFSF